MDLPISTRYQDLPSGESIFYRTAGKVDHPVILLLHGFPSSSHQYRNIIPLLATKYRVIAPDFPGFGFTTVDASYNYTFSALTETLRSFLRALPDPPQKYAIYIFDYGAPVGLRLALSDPGAIIAIITQSGNAYLEGLTSFWDLLKRYWASDDASDRDVLHGVLTLETTKWQYEDGTRDVHSIAPESYTLDQALLDRPGNKDIQLLLIKDYQSNLELYPKFHEYFRKSQVPLLVAWGKNDTIFSKEGAVAFLKDLPDAEVHLLDAGHFAVETETREIARLMLSFLEKHRIQ